LLLCKTRSSSGGVSLATQTVTGAHTDGGFVEIDATNMPGVYRLDLSDAILATGVNSVVVMLKGATGMAPLTLEIQLIDADLLNATSLGLTNLDATVSSRSTYAGGAVASVTGNVGGNVVGSVASVTGAVGSVTAGVTVTTNNDKTGYGLSAAAVQAVWDALLTSLTTVGSIGKKLADWVVGTIDTYTGNTKQTADHTANIAAIKTKTDLIGASVALETGGILANIHDTDLPAVKTDTAAILADTGTDGVVVAAASKTGYALAQGALGIAHITLVDRIYEMINNKMSVHDSTGVVTLLSIGGASTIATGSVNDDLTDTVRLELTW